MTRLALFLGLLLFSLPGTAAEISPEIQVQLQAAMQQYIDQVSTEGAYTYIDYKSEDLKTVYPANVHPMVLSLGKDYFVCAEMVDENGSHITADFLVRKFGDDYRVVQMILDNRPVVESAMKKVNSR